MSIIPCHIVCSIKDVNTVCNTFKWYVSYDNNFISYCIISYHSINIHIVHWHIRPKVLNPLSFCGKISPSPCVARDAVQSRSPLRPDQMTKVMEENLVNLHWSMEWEETKWILVIQSDLFGVVKCLFQGVKWPPTRGWKGHFESPGW